MFTVAVLGGTKIGRRTWRPGSRVWSVSILGGMEMDFRQAQMEEGVTRLTCISVFGGTKVRVPAGLPITTGGFALFGGNEAKTSAGQASATPSPRSLDITGITLFGGLSVTGGDDGD